MKVSSLDFLILVSVTFVEEQIVIQTMSFSILIYSHKCRTSYRKSHQKFSFFII